MDDGGTSRKTALVVDDDPILRTVVEAFLRKSGFDQVHGAENGRVALDMVEDADQPIDFILCDLNMPELDGFEFLRLLKESTFTGRIAIISGEHDSIVDAANGLADSHALNIVGTLRKPLNVKELEKVVKKSTAAPETKKNEKSLFVAPQDLRLALNSGQVIPYYQPKICVANGRVCGVEALARWIHPGFGLIPPGHFIPMAEQNDLVGILTQTILTAAVQDTTDWSDAGIEIGLSVNITSEALEDIAFPDVLTKVTMATGLPASRITLEVTESKILKWNATAAEVLGRLRIKGFGISIDDFGTGYSNIEQLRQFPFTELKIDQSFIQNALTDSFSRACVESSARMGKELGLRLVAEGVETAEQFDYAQSLGIDEVQGYFIAQPMPREEFLSWLDDQKSLRRRIV